MTLQNLIGKGILCCEKNLLKFFGADFLVLEEVDTLVEVLANKIYDDGFKPDVIVGILTGGDYPTKKLSEMFGVPYANMALYREKNYFCGVELESVIGLNKFRRRVSPVMHDAFEGVSDYEKVLLVDEDASSGETFNIAENEVRKSNDVEVVKSAALFTVPHGHSPDYSVEDQVPLNRFIHVPKRLPWLLFSPNFSHTDIS